MMDIYPDKLYLRFQQNYYNFSDNLSMDDCEEFLYNNLVEMIRISNLTFLNIQSITGNKRAVLNRLNEYVKEIIIWNKVNSQPSIQSNVLNSQFKFLYVFGDNPISRMFTHVNFNRGTLSNVWDIKIKGHKASHTEALVEKILINFGKEGDKIFDPFLGTGTTGMVCKRLNYDFIGVDISNEYCKIARDLIEGIKK